MKRHIRYIFILSILFSFSCEKNEGEKNINSWTKVIVPDVSTVYCLYGNIDHELVIGGLSEIVKTKDGGKNWSTVKVDVTAYELREHQDTLLAISLYNSGYQDFYSLDNGDTWTLKENKSLENLRTRVVTASNGIMYKIVDPKTYPKQPDSVLKSTDGGNSWEDIFPYKHYIYSIYLDKTDRLYIGVIGWDWNEATKVFDTNTGGNNAILYYLNK
jgi:photosystem II stability/assembly factor-like uncharacterized protein